MISDATLAQIMFWLFIAACCLASYWQLRADHWKHLFESTGEAVFRRYVKWYFERMTDEDVLRCVPPELLHGRILSTFIVGVWRSRYGQK